MLLVIVLYKLMFDGKIVCCIKVTYHQPITLKTPLCVVHGFLIATRRWFPVKYAPLGETGAPWSTMFFYQSIQADMIMLQRLTFLF